VLPLNLLYFNGQALQDHVRLSWGLSVSVNTDYFLIEKSKDGLSFETMAKVIAENTNVNVKSQYEFMDNQPFQSTFYRISQIDFDGNSNIYKTIQVTSANKELLVTQNVSGT